MVIDIQLGQRADIDTELLVRRQRIGHLLIQAVDALDDQDIILAQGEIIAFVLPPAGDKIEPRNLHLLPVQKSQHILIKLLHVDGSERLKIIVPLLILRRVLAVDEIIVRLHRMGLHAQRSQLNAQPVGKGSFARRRRAGDHNDLPSGLHNRLGDIADLLFLQRLLHQDNIPGLSVRNGLVQRTYVGDSQRAAPFFSGKLGIKQLAAFVNRGQKRRVLPLRRIQDKSAVKQFQRIYPDIPGIRDHVAVKIIVVILDAVHIHTGCGAEAEQPFLVLHTVPPEHLNGILGAEAPLVDDHLLLGNLPHAGIHPVQLLLRHRPAVDTLNVEAASHGKTGYQRIDLILTVHIVPGLQQDKQDAAPVSVDSGLVPGRQKYQLRLLFQLPVQFPQSSVHGNHKNIAVILILKILCNFQESRAVRILACLSSDSYSDHSVLLS